MLKLKKMNCSARNVLKKNMEAILLLMFMLKLPKLFPLMAKDVLGVEELYFMQKKYLKVEDATIGKKNTGMAKNYDMTLQPWTLVVYQGLVYLRAEV